MQDKRVGFWDELAVDVGWFHVMRSAVHAGRIAEIGPTAWAIYCVIKSHADKDSGTAYPTHKRIAELVGVSDKTVQRIIPELVAAGMITKSKERRNDRYQVLESLPLTDRQTGQSRGAAVVPYRAAALQSLLRDLQEYAASGRGPGNRDIHLTVNVTIVEAGGISNTYNDNSVNLTLVNTETAQAVPMPEHLRIKHGLKAASKRGDVTDV